MVPMKWMLRPGPLSSVFATFSSTHSSVSPFFRFFVGLGWYWSSSLHWEQTHEKLTNDAGPSIFLCSHLFFAFFVGLGVILAVFPSWGTYLLLLNGARVFAVFHFVVGLGVMFVTAPSWGPCHRLSPPVFPLFCGSGVILVILLLWGTHRCWMVPVVSLCFTFLWVRVSFWL
jgi:hypothetical protein